VLVTGATGLVGHGLVRDLLAKGYRVVAFARDPAKAARLLPASCRILPGDITDPEAVERAVRDCSLVFHAAGIPEQWQPDPGRFDAVNVEGSRTIARAALEKGVDTFVYVSTLDIFAPGESGLFDEGDLDPRPKATPYQRSKQEADRVIADLLGVGLPAIFIHPAAVYGPGPPGSLGLNAFLQRLCRGAVPVVPPGAIPVVFVEDVAAGCTRAATLAQPGDRFILSESTLTFAEIARIVTAQLGRPRSPVTMPLWAAYTIAALSERLARVTGHPPLLHQGQVRSSQRPGRPLTRHAQEILGWRPTPFLEGVRRTLDAFPPAGR